MFLKGTAAFVWQCEEGVFIIHAAEQFVLFSAIVEMSLDTEDQRLVKYLQMILNLDIGACIKR